MPQNHSLLLLVEDNADDAFLFRRALEKSRLDCCLQVAKTGSEAVAYLQDLDQHPRPDLMFLDLNLPGLDGFGVLKWIRDQPHLSTLPVVIFTGLNSSKHETLACELGAKSVLTKPAQPEDLAQVAKASGMCAIRAK